MSVFRKIFGSNSDKSKDKSEKEEHHKFVPDENAPVDEVFTMNFNNNGGKFLYCETIDEVQSNLEKIVEENNWSDKTALILNKRLKEKFKSMPNVCYQESIEQAIKSIKVKEGDLLLITGSLYGAAEVLSLN